MLKTTRLERKSELLIFMADIRIVLVGPEYQVNLGHAARIAKNFGYSKLYLVKPRCKIGFNARMYAKHAVDVLEKSVICSTLDEAVEGCGLVVGTTGVLRRHRKTIRNCVPLRKFSQMKLPKHVAILFGREGIGLRQEEIDRCGMLVTIESSRGYPILNITHAMGIVLYGLSRMEVAPAENASDAERKQLEIQFSSLVELYSDFLNEPHKVKMGWKRMLGRSAPTGLEARCVLGILRRARREIRESRGRN
jgi:tRNA/rRNA methyltransferase